MSDDDESETAAAEFIPIAQALELSLFTATQLRALVTAGIVGTQSVRGVKCYSVADLKRFDGAPRNAEPDEQSPLTVELRAITEGYRGMLDLALRQTKQAQDHERALILAFSKPLEQLGEGSKNLVGAVLEQNKQLVQRASDGDSARLQFVQAAESMLRDQRSELREQAELDRKAELRREVWEGVKKAAPHLLDGWKVTTGAGKLDAAMKLKDKLDINKVAALVAMRVLDDEETDLLCAAFGYDRAELDRLAKEGAEAAAQADAAEAAPEAAE